MSDTTSHVIHQSPGSLNIVPAPIVYEFWNLCSGISVLRIYGMGIQTVRIRFNTEKIMISKMNRKDQPDFQTLQREVAAP